MKTNLFCLIAGILTAGSLSAATVVADDFESGSFSTDWDATTGTIITTGGADGTMNFVAIGAGSGPLGATFDGGTGAFSIDFYTRVQNTTNRQFNLQVSSTSAAPSTNGATINLRHQSGGWAAFNGAWQALGGLGSLTADQWHRVRVTGSDWGTAGASFSVEVSDAGGSTFTSSQGGITFFQGGDPTTQEAMSFNFNSAFGSNPGFDVDQVSAQDVIPEPSAAALAGLAALGLVLRRRRP